MDLSAIALQGLDQAQVQLDAAASNLANAGAASISGADADTVNLSAQMVALTSAQTLFQVNIAALTTADQVQQTAIDLLG
jgi:flagellar basal body rod protein FlgG